MYGMAPLSLFLAIAAATPHLTPRRGIASMTVKEGNDACGSGQSLNCCYRIKEGDSVSSGDGVLSDVLNGLLASGLTIVDHCSALNVDGTTQCNGKSL